MELFQYKDIQTLNESELRVYNYVAAHRQEAAHASIRQLGQAVGVSTTTILRFCEKVGCQGYQELKYRLARSLEASGGQDWNAAQHWRQAFRSLETAIDDPSTQAALDQAARLLSQARAIHFLGVGTSGSLAEYGARYFANMGMVSTAVLDPFYPKPTFDLSGTVLMALSVSGETEQVLTQVDGYRSHQASIISITDTHECRLARLADCSLAYYMPVLFPPEALGPHNVTSQMAVVFYLELLAHMTYSLKSKNI